MFKLSTAPDQVWLCLKVAILSAEEVWEAQGLPHSCQVRWLQCPLDHFLGMVMEKHYHEIPVWRATYSNTKATAFSLRWKIIGIFPSAFHVSRMIWLRRNNWIWIWQWEFSEEANCDLWSDNNFNRKSLPRGRTFSRVQSFIFLSIPPASYKHIFLAFFT